MSRLSTHVLDVAAGRPAAGVEVRLLALDGPDERPLATARTDADGRVAALGPDVLPSGRYRLCFDVGSYFGGRNLATLFPVITVDFRLDHDDDAHLHLPVLVSPFAYSTYRGS